MLFFQFFQLIHQPVIFAIGNLWLVQNIITIIMVRNRLDERLIPFSKLLIHHGKYLISYNKNTILRYNKIARIIDRLKNGDLHQILSKYILADGLDPVYDAEKSHDSYLHDKKTGKEYLDLFSFFATQPIGFRHPKMVDPAFVHKLGTLAINRPTLSDVYTEEYTKFVETFGEIAGQKAFQYFFFIEGGAMGVENAL